MPKPRTVVLQDLEWTDQPRHVPVEYPAEPVEAFVNWLRTTKAWWEDPEAVHRKVTKLNADLAAIKQARRQPRAHITPERRAQIARDNLKKARAAQAAKRKVA